MISDSDIEQLHRKYAKTESDFELIYTHCRIIDEIALQLVRRNRNIVIDEQELHVSCMLHDIGAYQVLVDGKYVDGVRHGVFGEQILIREGLPNDLASVASHHTGVGLTKEDVAAQKLNIPVRDYRPSTPIEELVTYADKFHSKSHPPSEAPYFCTFDWFRESISQFDEQKARDFDELAEKFGIPELHSLSDKYGYQIKHLSH